MKRELKRPVGSFLYRKIHRFLNMRTIRERMRKIHVVPEDELTRLCEEYCIRILSNSLLVFFNPTVEMKQSRSWKQRSMVKSR